MKSASIAKRVASLLFALCSVSAVSAAMIPLAVGNAQTPGTTAPKTPAGPAAIGPVPPSGPTVQPPVQPPVRPPVVQPPVVRPTVKVPAIRIYPRPHSGDNRLRRPLVLGDPLPDLTAQQMNQFLDGKNAFMLTQTVEAGLGPIFNGVSCVACHSAPVPGGASTINTTRFGQNIGGRFDPLVSLGGSQLHQFAINPAAMELVPGLANVVARRNSTPIFGLGLIEAITDSTIIANRRQYGNDQIDGRVAMVNDVVAGRRMVGRFGWKSQHATLLSFSADAYHNEMGITNRHFREENAPNGNLNVLNQFDTRIDPEDDGRGQPLPAFESVAHFMRLLGPPPARRLIVPTITPTGAPTTTATKSITTVSKLTTTVSKPITPDGQFLFSSVGCAQCHTPMLRTGFNPIGALNFKEVWLYSDLLLHKMGSLADGIVQADATGSEFRTPPLWGAAFSAPYLHDGRAPTIDAAIRAHDGEGRLVKERYQRLTPAQQKLLTDFVLSL
jgi:cytochrome c551/c552